MAQLSQILGGAATPRQTGGIARVTNADASNDVRRAQPPTSVGHECSTRFAVRRSARTSAMKGGDSDMTFSEWFAFARTSWKREEGQTMAEYGVVLAVITIGAVAVFTALSGGISGALSRVIGLLPK
jgi:Flp pilus assembly pilin Flp